MKIVVAPQAFKGSLDAVGVAEAIARGARQIFPEAEVVVLPVADGGEGTVRALVQASRGHTVTTRVLGPLAQPVNATWGLLGDGQSAVIEMAAASGLPLIRRDQRNPLRTTSFGTGELVRHALDHDVRRLIIGIGGSATNDGGAGMVQALGVRFLDEHGEPLPFGGGSLGRLDRIDASELDPRLRGVDVEVACDVNNPLYGPEGASHVYGAQKGADSEMAALLDDNLHHYADVLARDLGKDVALVPGSGAAGGMGAALLAFLDARLKPGIEIVFRAIELDRHVRDADFVLTGEGRIDKQDIFGKAPVGVAQLAQRYGIPSIAVAGSTGKDYRIVYEYGLDAVIGTVNRPMGLERAIAESSRLITEAAVRACRIVRVGMKVERRAAGRGT